MEGRMREEEEAMVMEAGVRRIRGQRRREQCIYAEECVRIWERLAEKTKRDGRS